MFIWKKTWERMREQNWALEFSLKGVYNDLWKTKDELKEAHGVIEGAAYDAATLERDYITLNTKYKHMCEVLENIRTFGGLLPRHRRSIAAALDEAPLQKRKRD